MWALRRASYSLKSRALVVVTRACCANLEISSSYVEVKPGIFFCNHENCTCVAVKRFHNSTYVSSKLTIKGCALSSQAGAKSSGEEDDLEHVFSELETAPSADTIKESNADDQMEDEMISETDDSDEDDVDEPSSNELELSDAEADSSEKKSSGKQHPSKLLKAILAAPGLSIHTVLNKWVEEGKDLDRAEISITMLNLRKRKMFGRALQVSEWLGSQKEVSFVERDYASHVDLIAKVRGLPKAENYIQKIPTSFRGEVVYRTLLANCVMTSNVKKAEDTFNKMKDLEFPLTPFACNQLILLYRRTDKKKIADVLFLMEKENVKPSLFTYRILIDVKGQSNDMTGMDQIVETMKAEGIEPDMKIQAKLVEHYVNGGLKEKAEAVLKEMEGSDLKRNRAVCQSLLPLYAALGKADDVGRVWKICEPHPSLVECTAAIEAWGKLKKVEEAEAVFERMLKTWKLSSKHWNAILKVYADHKMLAKGKDIVKRMNDNGCRIGPLTWDALVKLYVEAGDVEKADSILQKASKQNMMKPMFSSYMAIMDRYAKRGDIHNTEKMFHRMRQSGYVSRLRQFQSLVQAYVSAQTPAYGMRERMKADNIFPNRMMAETLVKVDPFRKTAVSDLLD